MNQPILPAQVQQAQDFLDQLGPQELFDFAYYTIHHRPGLALQYQELAFPEPPADINPHTQEITCTACGSTIATPGIHPTCK